MVEVGLPHAPHGISAYYVIAPAEASSNLARYDGVRYGKRAGNGTLLDLYERTRAEGFGDEVKRRIMLGHVRALRGLLRGLLRARAAGPHEDRGRLPGRLRAVRLRRHARPRRRSHSSSGERTDDPLAMYMADYCTVPMSLAGIPAVSIPAGLAQPADGGGPPGGLPVGFQIAGPGVLRERDAGRRVCARAGGRLRHHEGVPVSGGAATGWEPVIGLEIHVQLSTRTKMFCACELSFGEPPNTRTCPVCLGHPGTLPTLNAEAVHYGLMIGARAGLRGRATIDLPPQELLLSRPAEGLPDQPVRHPAGVRRASRGPGRSLGADPPRPPGGGRRKADPPGRVGTHPRRGLVGGRLQPGRHAAGGDRHRARRPLRRRRPRVPPAPAHDAEADRRLGREHGGGLAALRRERVRAQGRGGGLPDQDGAEEHEQLPVPGARHRGGDRAPDRDLGVGRHGRPGDDPLRSR